MNQKDDLFYMKQALLEARRAADCGEVPVGAVVVCRGVVLARAHNLTEALNDVTAHAEMQAITAAANALGAKYLTDALCYGGAMCDVCRSDCLGTDRTACVRSG